MEKFGIIIYLLLNNLQPGKILSANLPIDELIKIAVDNKEGVIASNGALVVTTGKRTGRSPADKFIVDDAITHDAVNWNKDSQPIEPEKFAKLWQESEDYIKGKNIFTADMHVGASEEHYQPVHVENELAWHNVFCQSLFIKPNSFNPANKDWGIGQVQSIIKGKVTVNFQNVGKKVINAENIELKKINESK